MIKNKAETTLGWIEARLAEGRTVYLRTALKTTKLDRRVVSRWAKSPKPLFKLSEDGLRVAGNFIATPSTVLVKVTAV